MTRKAAASRRARQTSDKTEIAAVTLPLLPARREDVHVPFSSQAPFWRPHHPAASPALGQLPFLFWLIEAAKPRTIVQIGLGDGVVYMALCQACERLGSSTVCTGIQADEPLLPSDMRVQHDARYLDFSELRLGEPKIASRFGDEIDFLVFNQALDAETLASFESDWLPFLSDRAVILICDPGKVFPDKTAREVLAPRKDRTIVFGPVSAEGYALEVILYGTDQAERLTALAVQRPGDPAYLASRQVFNRLGQGIEAIEQTERLRKERDRLLRDPTQVAQGDLKAEVTALKAQLNEAWAEHEKRIDDIAILTEKYAEDLARLKNDNTRLAAAKTQLEAQLVATRTTHEARVRELEEQVRSRDIQHKVEREEVSRLRTAREAELLGKLDAATSEILRMQQIVTDLHRTAGEEIGRAIKVLIASERSGFLAKKMPILARAKLLVDKEIVEPDWYLERHPDVAAAGMDPALHYLLHGAEEGRIPRRRLDEAAQIIST